VDDRTDDCAFGAMMSLALRQEFRKLRFQMIADTLEAQVVSFSMFPTRAATGNAAGGVGVRNIERIE
jgi:hypothetical protein